MKEERPSLAALRVFTACGKNSSFTRAADELGISPAAVTHHIRALERWVGSPLFRRTGRSVHLTSDAAAVLPLLSGGFDQISEAAELLRARDGADRVVRVTAPPAFASKWLLPRLERFRRLHPDLDVWVSVATSAPRAGEAKPDVVIHYGIEPDGDLVGEPLLRDEVVPVASPAFVARYGPLDLPAQLRGAPLLHYFSDKVDKSFPDWPSWFKTHGVPGTVAADRGLRFDHPGLLVDQAAAGLGAALAKRILTIPDIDGGNLVQLFGEAIPVRSSYWALRPRGRTPRRPVLAFLDWIREDVHATWQALH